MPHNTLTYRHNLTIYTISIVENLPVCQHWLDSKRAYFMDKIRQKQNFPKSAPAVDKNHSNSSLRWAKTPILILFHGQIHARLKLKCLFAPDSVRRLLRALRSLFFFSLPLTRLGSLSEKAFAKKMPDTEIIFRLFLEQASAPISLRLIFRSERSR